MAILIEDKLLFIHTPRTGGEWFCKALNNANVSFKPIGDKHAHACSNLDIYNLITNKNIKSMTFIRHPAEWYKSHWEMKMYRDGNIEYKKWNIFEATAMWHPTWDLDNECFSSDFNEFVSICSYKLPSYLSYLYDNYTRKSALEMVDYIIDTHDIENKIYNIFIENKININIYNFLNTPRHNSFKNDNILYTEDSISKILKSERRCIEKFNFINKLEDLKYLIEN